MFPAKQEFAHSRIALLKEGIPETSTDSRGELPHSQIDCASRVNYYVVGHSGWPQQVYQIHYHKKIHSLKVSTQSTSKHVNLVDMLLDRML